MTSPEHARSLLSTALNQAVTNAIRNERAYVATAEQQTVRDGEAVGFIEIAGGSESVTHIEFPIKFLEKPVFTAGLELPDNVTLTWGAFPQWSATVASWDRQPLADQKLYTGCTLGLLVLGPNQAILHYRFAARCYANPVGTTGSVTSTL